MTAQPTEERATQPAVAVGADDRSAAARRMRIAGRRAADMPPPSPVGRPAAPDAPAAEASAPRDDPGTPGAAEPPALTAEPDLTSPSTAVGPPVSAPQPAAQPAQAGAATTELHVKVLQGLLDAAAIPARVLAVEPGPTGMSATLTTDAGLDAALLKTVLDPARVLLNAAKLHVVATGPGQLRLQSTRPSQGRARQVAAWVPKPLRDAVDAAKDPGVSYTDFVLNALNGQLGRLPTYFTRSLTADGPIRLRGARVRKGLDTPVQLWLYLDPDQEAAVDEAVASSGAGSRSALVTRVLEEAVGVVTTPRYSG